MIVRPLTAGALLLSATLAGCGQEESPRSRPATESALPAPASAPSDGVAAGAGAQTVGGDAKSN